ncbi:MAG TPA: diguanylate cyclase, partial [Candidatus Ozemobacteraceae bacterium]|nr:diguanylate cyclase [Candidatus Ozemobacteraceae bacterium]
VIFLFYNGYYIDLENRSIDMRFQYRGELPPSRDVVLVSITDKCIAKLGPWPWPRATHARLLDVLASAGARVVAFDVMFSEPSIAGPEDDAVFARAVASFGRVVLPLVMVKKTILDNDTCEMVDRLVADRPIPELRIPGASEGFIDMEHMDMNADGVIRHLFLEKRLGNDLFRCFGLVIAAKLLDAAVETTPEGIRVGERALSYYTRRELSRPDASISSLMLNYGGKTGYFDDVPYHEALEGIFPPGLMRGKAVIIGTRAKGTSEDVKFSPYGAIAGMEIHANLVHNIASGRILHRMSPQGTCGLIMIMTLLIAWIIWRTGGWGGNLLVGLVWAGWPVIGFLAFRGDRVFEIMPFVIMVPVQWALMRLSQQFQDLRQRNRELARKVRELSMVNEVSQAVNFMGDLNRTLDTILSRCVQALSAERGSLFMLDERYESLVEAAVVFGVETGASVDPALKAKFKSGEGVAGDVFAKGQPRLISDVRREQGFENFAGGRGDVRSILCVPLQVRDEPIGVMNIVNKITDSFDQEDLQMALTMANQAAVVIEKARLFNLATIDGLTGLIVRRHFQSRMEEEFRRAKRYEKPLSFIMTDIDHFKKFNDTWGHQTGDMVLREVAKIVRCTIRDTDVAARYGGEEFCVILPETDLEGGRLFAERLRQKVETSAFPGPKGDLSVTISLGLSSLPYNYADTTVEMMKIADEALYEAKDAGRNRVGVSSVTSAPSPEQPADPEAPSLPSSPSAT